MSETKNRLYESMTRVTNCNYVVRVWTTEPVMKFGPREDIELAVKDSEPNPVSIAQVLDAFPDISAYEILDEFGNGVVVYVDWP